jgi:hypothetical protein
MRVFSFPVVWLIISGGIAFSQQASSVTIEGKSIAVRYSAPSANTQKVFGGIVPFNRVWQIGKGAPAAFHTDVDLILEGLSVPKGDYSLYLLPGDSAKWMLIVSRQTGQKALTYDPKSDLGRVPMKTAKAGARVETCQLGLTKTAPLAAKLDLAWEDTVGTARFHLDRVTSDPEW